MTEQLTLAEHFLSDKFLSEKINNTSFNIGYVALDIARETNPNVTIASYRRLERILAKAKLGINPKEEYSKDDSERILSSIDEIIRDEGIAIASPLSDEQLNRIMTRAREQIGKLSNYDKKDAARIFSEIMNDEERRPEINLDNLFVNKGYEINSLSCLGYSILMLSVAENIGLPITPVIVPSHIFVRWNDLNWDPGWLGKGATDEDYVKKHNIHPSLIEKRLMLKNITRQQVVAALYVNKATFRNRQEKYEEAMMELALAKNLDPNYFGTYSLMAEGFIRQGQLDKAMDNLSKSLEINPNFVEGYFLRSIIHMANENYPEALNDLNQGINVGLQSQFIFDRRDLSMLYQQKMIIQRITGDDAGFRKTVKSIMALSMVSDYAPAPFLSR